MASGRNGDETSISITIFLDFNFMGPKRSLILYFGVESRKCQFPHTARKNLFIWRTSKRLVCGSCFSSFAFSLYTITIDLISNAFMYFWTTHSVRPAWRKIIVPK